MTRSSLFALILAVFVSGCAPEDAGPKCIFDCQLCSDSQCPPDRCGVKVVLSPECKDLGAPFAEVAVGQCVEEQNVDAGDSIRLCATVKKNETANIVVRGEDWTWPRQVYCSPEKAGGFIILTLYCQEFGDNNLSTDVVE